MIIYQTIRQGFLTVNKTGAYFSLISAGSVVNVRLSEKGRVILDTKMWAGMSIDKALPFDEITITGEDGAVTFWAGDTSITGSASISVKGANAVRTKTVDVLGVKLLTSSDLTRQSVRLRSNKDVFLGGGGVNGSGWKLKANVAEDFPIAGSVYAYKQLPQLEINKTEIIASYPAPTGLEAQAVSLGCYHVSADGQTILASKYNTLSSYVISQDGGATWTEPEWVSDSNFVGAGYYLVQDRPRSAVYLLVAQPSSTGSLKIFVSYDDGVSFAFLKYISAETEVGIGYLNFDPYGYVIDGVLFFNCAKWWGIFNPNSLEVTNTERYESLTTAIKKADAAYTESSSIRVKITSADGQKMILSYSHVGGKTLYSGDGGATFEVVANVYLNPQIDNTGNFLAGIAIYDSYYPWFSTNGGESWEQFSSGGALASDKFINFIDDKWLQIGNGTLKLFYSLNGSYQTDSATVSGLLKKDGGITTESGDIVTPKGSAATGQEMQRIKVSSGGDLSPAKVEVLELLS
ncbi:hypothetical protein [Shewanella baltica]|uniref:hypothetical protein n=1 Tax=Shewanella baltica TaxID=62322 RepID=UPI003D7A9FF2